MENLSPLVSVLIPTYNGAPYIETALLSVLKQDYPDVEIIVSDDASLDTTLDTLKLIKRENDTKDQIRILFSDTNQGIAKNMNKGLSETTGKYVAILDQDDEWIDSTKLTKQVEFLENNPDYGLLGTQREVIFNGTPLPSPLPTTDTEIRSVIPKICPFQHSSVLFRNDLLKELGGYDATYKYAMDYDLFYRFLREAKGANLDIFSIKYYFHNMNTSSQFTSKQIRETLDIKRKNRDDFPLNFLLFGIQLGNLLSVKFLGHYDWYQKLKYCVKRHVIQQK
ncbi:MAG: glycosyltransferase [Candidatus Absconditabacteria bacterium]|nr:glycosyltransferase [Candidatus Absconditabacteria bacterium]MDD3868304.1 glycosyltransferase [Candidatus Absconditabacteria bacterium]MDD4714007.1 glycosyltransferase [Candidatus Absconditabacteria bacterium]